MQESNRKQWQEEEWDNEANPWYQQAQAAARALTERPAFSYDPGRDPMYLAARGEVLRQGSRAMEDTMGKAAGLTGGYGSSYSQLLGSRAYDSALTKLTQLLPDYYDRARAVYDKKTKDLSDELGLALGLFDKDYQAYLDKVQARERAEAAALKQSQWEQEFEARQAQWRQEFDAEQNRRNQEAMDKNSRWKQEFEEDRRRWEAEYLREAERWAAQQANAQASRTEAQREQDRSYAYRMAMLALQQGLTVSDSLLTVAGIDKSYAELLRRYYAALHSGG